MSTPIGHYMSESNYNTAKMSSSAKLSTPAFSGIVRERQALAVPIMLCTSVSFGGFLAGWDVGTIGGITNMESFSQNFGTLVNTWTGERRLPAISVGLIISVFSVSSAVGGLTLAKLGDYQGRKFGIYVALVVYCVGLWITLMNDTNWIQFLIGRIVTGLAVGSTGVLVPIYLSEIAPVTIGSTMIGSYQVQTTLGILMGNIVNYFSHQVLDNEVRNMSWQLPLILGYLWVLIITIGLIFTPESAPFLVARKNAIPDAKASFAKMNAISRADPKTLEFIDRSLREKHKSRKEGKSQDILDWARSRPRLGLRLLVGICVMSFQQLSGINYFFYYGTTIFEARQMDSYVVTIILSLVNFLSTFGGLYVVQASGRRPSLLIGSIGMFCCMLVYASVGSFAPRNTASYAVVIIATCVYLIFFATTLGPVTVILVAELFPMRTKATSMAVCTSFYWMCNFLVSFLTPIIADQIGFLYGYFFAGFLLVSAVFAWFMVPETKYMTQADIDAFYDKVR